MRQMQPVLWTKGVVLSPQHLQTQDRFLEDVLQFQVAALAPYAWGFHRLEVDHEALAGGTFALSSAAGILPDGLLFDMPDADPAPPPRALEGAFAPDQQELDIYLAIPEYRRNGHNVSGEEGAASTRYTADVELRRDENTGLQEKPIQIARKNFRFLTGNEALEGSSVLRAARLRRAPTGELQLDPRFVPPLVDIGASPFLDAIARRLVEICSAKSGQLAGMRRQRNQSLADFSISDIASFWLLYTINTHLPELRHLFATRRGHPRALYEAMLSLAGALTTFSTTLHPRDLPTYAHDDLSRCFAQLDEQLRTLLETVVPARSASLPMKLVQPAIWATALDQDAYLAAPQLFLALAADVAPAVLGTRAPQLVKVASADRVEHLIRHALPGLPLTYVASPPTAVPVRVDYQYFLLSQAGPEWDAIVRARNLAAYIPADLPNVQAELLVVLPARS